MKFIINSAIFDAHPEVLLGAVVLKDIDNLGPSNDLLQKTLQEAQVAAQEKLAGVPITEHPHIAPWREKYRSFGAKPKKYPSSIEALSRRIAKGDDVPTINKLVDAYNAISVRYLIPIGGEDLDCMKGNLELTFAGDNEEAVTVLGDSEAKQPAQGEVIYKDDVGTICRRWNWREVDRAKLTEQTKNAIIVMEALPPFNREGLQQALDEFTSVAIEHCGGRAESVLFDSNNREFVLFAEGERRAA